MNTTDKLITIQLGFFIVFVGVFYVHYYYGNTNQMILYAFISLIVWIGVTSIGDRK